MAIRTTADAVRGISEVDDNIDLAPFIEAASGLVDDVCCTSGYSDAKLERIERWLSAHMYHIIDPQANVDQVGSSAGTIRQQFDSRVDLGLNVTRYGQQAMIIDTAGNLAMLNAATEKGKSRKVTALWLGKAESEMSEYQK